MDSDFVSCRSESGGLYDGADGRRAGDIVYTGRLRGSAGGFGGVRVGAAAAGEGAKCRGQQKLIWEIKKVIKNSLQNRYKRFYNEKHIDRYLFCQRKNRFMNVFFHLRDSFRLSEMIPYYLNV